MILDNIGYQNLKILQCFFVPKIVMKSLL